MRHQSDRQILDGLRGFVQEIITEAISLPASDLPARASAAPARKAPTKRAPAKRAPARKPTTQHLSPMQTRIVGAVQAGYRSGAEIAREIGSSRVSVNVQLGRLARAGILQRAHRGVYEVAR